MLPADVKTPQVGGKFEVEPLEARVFLSLNPSGLEQESLELLQRMRLNPQAELDLLLNTGDPNINSALSFFDVDADVLRQQWASLEPAPPLAWNESLMASTLFHTQQMRDADVQAHQVPAEPGVRDEEPGLRARATNAGYTEQSGLGENVFAYVKSMLHAQAAYAIDWGEGPDGIQDPPGHRNTIMKPAYREVGISVLNTLSGNTTGPMLQTQDFGAPTSFGDSFLVGVVYVDQNDDGRYNSGEGLSDVDIEIVGTGGVHETKTLNAGGYQVRLPEGTYTITAESDELGGSVSVENIVIGAENVKVDFQPPEGPGGGPGDVTAPTAELDANDVTTAGRVNYRFYVTYSDDDEVDVTTFGDRAVRVLGPDGFRQYARIVTQPDDIDSNEYRLRYEITPPRGYWRPEDNGTYEVVLRDNEVADVSGNPVAGGELGEFVVNIDADDVPTAQLVAPRVKTAGGTEQAFKIIFRDNRAIDASDLRDGTVEIIGPNDYRTRAKLDRRNSDEDGKKRIGYYTFNVPGKQWDSGDNGRYKVYVRAHKISDIDGNFVAPAKVASITVSIPEESASDRRERRGRTAARNAALALAHGQDRGSDDDDDDDASEKIRRLSAWEVLNAGDDDDVLTSA
jgi:uncharacterized protein YkwD